MARNLMKQQAALAAIKYLDESSIIGVGTGSTTNIFIEELAKQKFKIQATIASSIQTEHKLKQYGFEVISLNDIDELNFYVDGADAYNNLKQLVKGGGGALTREKILANASKMFICMVDETKKPEVLGKLPLPIEVIPMARSYVARQIVKLGGTPIYREHYLTDNNNIILDIHNLVINEPIKLEEKLNNIAGIVTCGLFAARSADVIIIGHEKNATAIK
jgi:ribose 5-phosphate isomerase A